MGRSVPLSPTSTHPIAAYPPCTPFSHAITLPPAFLPSQEDAGSQNTPHPSAISARSPPASPGSPGSPPLTCGVGTRLCSAPCAPPGPAEGVYKGPGRNFWKLGKPSKNARGGRGRGGSVPALSRPAANGRECRPRAAEGGSGCMGGCALSPPAGVPGTAPARPQPVPSQPLQQEDGELFPAKTVLLPFCRARAHLISISPCPWHLPQLDGCWHQRQGVLYLFSVSGLSPSVKSGVVQRASATTGAVTGSQCLTSAPSCHLKCAPDW